jgi:hypothetical protein
MMIYIDSDFKCYTEPAEDRTVVETAAFDGKCKKYIEGYRFVPDGQEWTRSDCVVFTGEMIAPFVDSRLLAAYQSGYEEMLAEMQDMQDALNTLGVELDG